MPLKKGTFKEKSGINLRLPLLSPSMIPLTDSERQKLAPCLPLSGLGGLGRLDGASVLGEVSVLRGRSIPNRER